MYDRYSKLTRHDPTVSVIFSGLQTLWKVMTSLFTRDLDRSVSFGDLIVDRWEKAKYLGFGTNTNVYDNCLILGSPIVGKNCWIGPNTILDGSGVLEIGDNCTISAGAHIYTHDNVKMTLSKKSSDIGIERKRTQIGDCVYISPHAIILKGSHIGNHCLVLPHAVVKGIYPPCSIIGGNPSKKIGTVDISSSGRIAYDFYE